MLQAGYATTWIPIRVRPRIGRSTVTVFDGLNALMLIVRLISLFAPLRVFVPISGLALCVGLWYMAESYLLYQEASVKALLAIVASILFFLFGLLADQIAALRRGEAAYRRDEWLTPAASGLDVDGRSELCGGPPNAASERAGEQPQQRPAERA
jgi:hypothetical protein